METKKLTRTEIEKALKDAGYKKVTFLPKVIQEEQKVAKRGKDGNIPAVDVKVLDIVVEPAHLKDEKNYTALKVLADLKVDYRELQEFSGAIFVRWVRGLE